MFRARKIWLLPVLLTLMVGCQPVDSFNPLYRDKDLTFDPSLVGRWKENDATIEFVKSGDNAYDVIFFDNSRPPEELRMDGRLFNLGGHHFLDLSPKKWAANPDTFAVDWVGKQSNITPSLVHAGDGSYIQFSSSKSNRMEMQLRVVHWFFRVANDDKSLTLDYVDDDRLDKAMSQKAVTLDHLKVGAPPSAGQSDDRQLLLTASTADLQKFVLDHVNDSQTFADSLKFQRMEGPNSAADQH